MSQNHLGTYQILLYKSPSKMKRKCSSTSLDKILDDIYINHSVQILQNPTLRVKKYSTQQLNKLQVPSTLTPVSESQKVAAWVGDLLHSIKCEKFDSMNLDLEDAPFSNTDGEVKFLLFLGALGKEYIASIGEQLEEYLDSLIFISSSVTENSGKTLYFSDNQQCLQLATYFQVVDPLGGGLYPLDYLVVVDSRDFVRCKIPIRICRNNFHSPHEKFGVDLQNLASLVKEQIQHFIATQTLKH